MTAPGDALVDLVHAIDRLDWDGVRAVLADELVTDGNLDLPATATERADAGKGRAAGG